MTQPTPQSVTDAFFALDSAERKDALAKMFSTFVNSAKMDEMRELATDMTHDHRTLVQMKFGLFLQFMKALAHANETGNYDARNEYAVKTAAEIMKATGGNTFGPFI